MQSTMLRRSQAALLLHGRSCAQAARAFATTSQTGQESEPQATYHVPAGHANSDLSDVACNLSLSRRRDLTLRQDLRVVEDGKSATIADILKVVLGAIVLLCSGYRPWSCGLLQGARAPMSHAHASDLH